MKALGRRLFGVGVFWLCLAVGGVQEARAVRLEKIRHAAHDKFYRIVLDLSSVPEYRTGIVEQGNVALLDLDNTPVSSTSRFGIEHPQSPVKEIVVEPLDGSRARVRFELTRSGVQPKLFTLTDPDRLVIDFFTSVADRPLDPKQRNFKTVIIDPGHGGWDAGARSRYCRWAEKDIVLDIALRLVQYFRQSDSFQAYLTRDKDILPFVQGKEPDPEDAAQRKQLRRESLKGRIEFANRKFPHAGDTYTADLFVSIHVNAARNRNARGFEVWILGDAEAQDEEGWELLRAENGETILGSVEVTDTDSARTLISMFSDRITNELNPTLAYHINKQMGRVDGGDEGFDSRGVKKGPFRVLRNLAMPSVLVEVGFISNRSEAERYLTEEWFRQRVAYALYTAINHYFQDIDRGGFVPELVREPEKPEPKYDLYVVRKGDSLYKIGRRYNIPYKWIKEFNHLGSDQLRIGQELKIPRRLAS